MGEPTEKNADVVDDPEPRLEPEGAGVDVALETAQPAEIGPAPSVAAAPVLAAAPPGVSAPAEAGAPASVVAPKVGAQLESGKRQPASYLFFSIVAAVSAGLDLWSKAWASARLVGIDVATYAPKKVVLLQGYLDFQYAQNPGGAWSMLRSLPEVGRRPFFLMVSTVASVFIASVYARIDRRQWAMRWGLPLALGGAIGNLVDRIRNGWVVDFIHFWFKKKVGEYHWPTFNIADVWIVIGVGLMAIDVFTSRKVRASIEAYEDAHAPAEPSHAADDPAPPAAG